MKLIIDIPDNEYEHIKEYYEKNDTVEATYSYIYHGIPLDKIRTDIAKDLSNTEKKNRWTLDDIDCGVCVGLKKALDIIDKYREESI